MRKGADKEHLCFDMLLQAVNKNGWVAADSCYSNLGNRHLHNHKDQKNWNMVHRHCNLVAHLMSQNLMNYKQQKTRLDHLVHFLQVGALVDYIGKWNLGATHSHWNCHPPCD